MLTAPLQLRREKIEKEGRDDDAALDAFSHQASTGGGIRCDSSCSLSLLAATLAVD